MRLFCTFTETILESALHFLQVSHPASPRGHSPDALLSPIIMSHFGTGISTLGTSLLLKMKGTVIATTAETMRLCVTTSKEVVPLD